MLTFDPEPHIYRWNGVVVPNVTRILEVAGVVDWSMVPPEILAEAQARGRRVHRMCELDDHGILDESTVDESERGYLQAWRHCLAATGCSVTDCEMGVYHERYKYAGTLDRLLTHPRARRDWLLDIKTGVPLPATGPQTAAYLYALPQHHWNRERWAAYLQPDGHFSLIPYRDASDMQVFLAALTLFHWHKKELVEWPPKHNASPR